MSKDIKNKNEQLSILSNFKTSIIPSDNKFMYSNADDVLIISILFAIAIAESKIDKSNCIYWEDDKEWNNHRESREYDNHIQRLLCYLKSIGTYNCEKYKCSNNGFHRVKLNCSKRNNVGFVMHSVKKNTRYLEQYFRMNQNINEPKFFIVRYDIDNLTERIESISFDIPNSKGEIEESFDLISSYNVIKDYVSNEKDKNSLIENFKNQLQELNRLMEDNNGKDS